MQRSAIVGSAEAFTTSLKGTFSSGEKEELLLLLSKSSYAVFSGVADFVKLIHSKLFSWYGFSVALPYYYLVYGLPMQEAARPVEEGWYNVGERVLGLFSVEARKKKEAYSSKSDHVMWKGSLEVGEGGRGRSAARFKQTWLPPLLTPQCRHFHLPNTDKVFNTFMK